MIRVFDPGIIGEGLGAYVVYSVEVVMEPLYSAEVSRRYSDFVWLRDQLRQALPGHVLPPLPEQNRFW